MRTGMITSFMVLAMWLDSMAAICQQGGRGDLRMLWYNVENLFHPDNDTIPGDDEFTPAGARGWSYSRYRRKVTLIAKVIVAAGQWDPPGIVGLCEIENRKVLDDLVSHPILEPYGYGIIHRDGPDPRGMEVACLFRDERIRVESWETYGIRGDPGSRAGRDMLHLEISWNIRDTLDLFLVHFISKYGGAGATAEARTEQAATLVMKADSVLNRRDRGFAIIAGDFNEPFNGYSLWPFRSAAILEDSIMSIGLKGTLGTYRYRGSWSRIDQFLAAGQTGRYRLEGMVLELPGLLTEDATYGGFKPARTYEGFRYLGGVSDHLPIMLDISRRPFLIRSGQ